MNDLGKVHRDGNGARRGRRMRYSSPPCMVLSYPIPSPWDPAKPHATP